MSQAKLRKMYPHMLYINVINELIKPEQEYASNAPCARLKCKMTMTFVSST